MKKNVLTDNLSAPLNGAATAKIDIQAGDGNLTIDQLSGGGQLLASGTLQYFESQGAPKRSLVSISGQAALTLKGGASSQPRFRLPWAACNGATEWQIHLNPAVPSEITAHSDGGNLKLNLAGMAVTRLFAVTGGGNIDLALPENAADLSLTAKTGAGNVTVEIPSGVAVRIQATTGLGKAIVDPRFNKMDKNTYQTPDFDHAAQKVEITVDSGAGNVIVMVM
jgi:hypothetical protein